MIRGEKKIIYKKINVREKLVDISVKRRCSLIFGPFFDLLFSYYRTGTRSAAVVYMYTVLYITDSIQFDRTTHLPSDVVYTSQTLY
jgi:hypothetical protein